MPEHRWACQRSDAMDYLDRVQKLGWVSDWSQIIRHFSGVSCCVYFGHEASNIALPSVFTGQKVKTRQRFTGRLNEEIQVKSSSQHMKDSIAESMEGKKDIYGRCFATCHSSQHQKEYVKWLKGWLTAPRVILKIVTLFSFKYGCK